MSWNIYCVHKWKNEHLATPEGKPTVVYGKRCVLCHEWVKEGDPEPQVIIGRAEPALTPSEAANEIYLEAQKKLSEGRSRVD